MQRIGADDGTLGKEEFSKSRDDVLYTTKPWLWPIRDTDEGRCRVLPSDGPLQVVAVRGKKIEICSQSLWMFSVHSAFRKRVLEIVEWIWFERFILFVILVNSILLAAYQYREDANNSFNYFVDKVADPIFTLFFSLECVLKIIAVGLFFDRNTYLRDAWNWLDFIVVVTAVISLLVGGEKISTLRVFRVLRPLRSLNALPELKRLVQTMLNSIPQLVDVSIMGLFLFVIFGIVGITLWDGVYYRQCRRTPNPVLSSRDGAPCWEWEPTGEDRLCGGRYTCQEGWCGGHIADPSEKLRPVFPGGSHQNFPWCPMNGRSDLQPINMPAKLKPPTDFIHFDNIGGALLVVFQSMTMEGWVDIMFEIQDGDSVPLATIYWFLLITFASFFLLNIFLAVIDESFHRLQQQKEGASTAVVDDGEMSPYPSEANRSPRRKRLEPQEVDDEDKSPELTAMALIANEQEDPIGGSTRMSLSSEDYELLQVSYCYEHIILPIQNLVESERFADFIMFFIVGNTVTMSLEKFPPDIHLQDFLHVCEWVFIIVFTLEMILYLLARGPVKYVKNPLTLFDGFIVVVSIVEKFAADTAALRAFRGFRLVRVVFKIAKRWDSFRVLLKAMMKMMLSLQYFALLFGLVLYVFTLLFLVFFSRSFRFKDEEHAERLINHESAWCTGPGFPGPENDDCIPRAHFDTFVWAFVTVFQIMSGENWNMVMYDGLRAGGWYFVCFFVFVILFGQIMILNLFLTILMAKFQEARPNLEAEEKEKKVAAKMMKEKQRTREYKRKVLQQTKSAAWMQTVHQASRRSQAGREPIEGLESFPGGDLYKEMKANKTASSSTLILKSVTTADVQVAEQNHKIDGNSTMDTASRPPEDKVVSGCPSAAEGSGVGDQTALAIIAGESIDPTQSDETCVEDPMGAPEQSTAVGSSVRSQDWLPGQMVTTPASLDRLQQQSDPQLSTSTPCGKSEVYPKHAGTDTLTMATHSSSPSTMPLRSAASEDDQMSQPADFHVPTAKSSRVAPQPEDSTSLLHATESSLDAGRVTSCPSLQSLQGPRAWPHGYSLFIFSRRNCIRRHLLDIVYQKTDGHQKAFDTFILVCILISSGCMMFDSPLWNPRHWFVVILRVADDVFMYIFVLEMAMKLIAFGLVWGDQAYLKSAWNWLDGIVVVVSMIGKFDGNNVSFFRTLRILRAFRPLRVVSRNENLKVVVRTIFKSFRELLILGVLTFVFILIIGILFMSQLNGLFSQCETGGVGPLGSDSFTTPLCIGSGRESVCAAGVYNETAPGEWLHAPCSDSCSAPSLGVPPVSWQRPTVDTPMCIGRCHPKRRRDAGLPPQDICPPELTSTEQFPSVCPRGELNLDPNDTSNTPEELVGIHYVRTMMKERVLRCGGPEPGSCQDLFCPEGVSEEDAKTCRANCWKHPDFCYETCQSSRNSGSRNDVHSNSLCEQCLSECEASCHCKDFCTGYTKDAAVCIEQGGKWQPTIHQNFNNVFNSFLTLVEISTTEMWLDVMYNSVDGTSHYRQPERDNQIYWTICFVVYIFFGNMIILNLGVGVIVENFIDIKKGDGGIMLTPAQAAWIKSQRNLFERRLFFPLTHLHMRTPLRRKVYKLIDSKHFDHFIMGAIVLNTGCMMLQIFPEPYDWWEQMVEVGNYTFAALFTVEFLLKIIALRRNYWQDSWNLFDFFVVMATLVGILVNAFLDDGKGSVGSVVSVIRIFRIARLFRLIRFLKGLNKIFMALLLSVPRLFNVFSILLLMLVLYSILGVQLFAKVKYTGLLNDHGNFRNFFWAFVTLFRSMTGEAWNEIMHSLSKDEADFLREGSWCSPPEFFDEVNKYNVLQDKCLIDHPNACGTEFPFFHIIYFVTYIFIVYFIIFNLLIAVILEGYDDGTKSAEQELIDDCIRLWKKYDPNLTMALRYQDAFNFIEEALNEHAHDNAEREKGSIFGKSVLKNVQNQNLQAIPMKYAQTLKYLAVNEDGRVQFLMAVKFVFRLTIAKNNKEILEEIEASEMALTQYGNQKLVHKLRRLELKQTHRHGIGSTTTMRAQVAAAKIQHFYEVRKENRRRRKEAKERKKSGCDNVGGREAVAVEGSTSAEVATQPLVSTGSTEPANDGASPTQASSAYRAGSGSLESAADSSPSIRKISSHAGEVSDAGWDGDETKEAHLEPRDGAAYDGLDEPGRQRRGPMRERPATHVPPEPTSQEKDLRVAGSQPEPEPPQEVMVPPVAG